MRYTAIIKQDGNWWIGWIKEVSGINCQEKTYQELLDTLKITLKEAIELNEENAMSLAGANYQEELISV